METIAVYWEPIVKTYGFQQKTGLTLIGALFARGHMIDWGARIQSLGAGEGRFLLAIGQMVGTETLQLQMLFEKSTAERVRPELEKLAKISPHTVLTVDTPVELIFFHGPHFGDRYGIADTAFGALARKKLEVLAAACTGASLYIVVSEKNAQAAVNILSEKFDVPQPEKKQT